MRQHLLIDADDTLWENNVYFEAAFEEFCSFLSHSTLSPLEVRAILDEIELVNNKVHGYGSLNFARNMQECYRRIAERDIRESDLGTIMQLAERIMAQPIELIEGVEETLDYLARRHDLTLFTKGHPEEQKLKVERSGLAVYFGHTAIVKEKDRAAYAELAADRHLDSSRTWMVGNSPKSDINPAIEAGLGAVYIPHSRTWHLERQEIIRDHGRLLELEQFSDLQQHF
jgi:putative hydrolase of the HAD superfamily